MSILDSIHEAEAKADQIRQEARLEARNILADAAAKASADSEAKINAAREEYQSKLASLQDQTEKEMRAYLEEKHKMNQELAKSAKQYIPDAADYIIGKVIG